MKVLFLRGTLIAAILCIGASVLLFSQTSADTAPAVYRTAVHSDSCLKLPYLKKAGMQGTISVWIVDGAYIRTYIDEEFTNFGQHYNFSFIPKNEFWLDREEQEDEQTFFIDHLFIEYRLMKKGVSYDSALEAADRQEMIERKQSGDVRKVLQKNGLPDPAKVHLRLWKKLESGLSVWIVDGRLVRSAFDVDFTEGGHEFVYEFVPHNEVWIDNDLQESERPFVLVHELHERNLMMEGLEYSRAHRDASVLESYCRHHTDELHVKLGNEGWE
jgi:hypothetical protein